MTKTIAEKLQIKPGNSVHVVGASAEELALLEPLPTQPSFSRATRRNWMNFSCPFASI